MKKSFKLGISFLAVTAMAYYLAYIDLPVYSCLSDYLHAHLNEPQQYFYIVTIYSMLVLWAVWVPYLSPIYYLRMPNLIEIINKRNIVYSFIFGIFTFFAYVLTAVFAGYEINISTEYIFIVFMPVLYYFMCFELSGAIYLLTKKSVLSILLLFLINMIVICVYYAADFYIYNNGMSDSIYHRIFYVYVTAVAVVCLFFNEIYVKRKEIY